MQFSISNNDIFRWDLINILCRKLKLMQFIILIKRSEEVSNKIMHFMGPSITVIKKRFACYRNKGARLMTNFMLQGTLCQTCQKKQTKHWIPNFIIISFVSSISIGRIFTDDGCIGSSPRPAFSASVHGAETTNVLIWPLLFWELWWLLLNNNCPCF